MEPEHKFQKEAISLLKDIKNETYKREGLLKIPVYKDNEKVAFLIPITKKNLIDSDDNKKIIKLLAKWREQNSRWFDVFKVTEEGTKKWLKEKVVGCDDRILFLIKTLDDSIVGHIGFFRFNSEDNSCELDNVMRGEKSQVHGLMTCVTKTLLNWAFDELNLKIITLRTFSENERAIALYEKCGFKKVKDIPLEKIVNGDSIRWEEMKDDRPAAVDRYFSQYRIYKNEIKN